MFNRIKKNELEVFPYTIKKEAVAIENLKRLESELIRIEDFLRNSRDFLVYSRAYGSQFSIGKPLYSLLWERNSADVRESLKHVLVTSYRTTGNSASCYLISHINISEDSEHVIPPLKKVTF